ncbi:hypothetical protein [Enterococcus sp. DIV1420a]|uniref:hypothetical protein n=1 Tax=Enterococcus sp. DIV1420a TaxID=2774672 RepID=UPI003F230021
MTKYPTQESKIRRQKHVANMRHEAMKNIYELGYPFGYFKASCQFAIETPIGVIDYFGINGTWVVRKGQDRGKSIRKMKQYIKNRAGDLVEKVKVVKCSGYLDKNGNLTNQIKQAYHFTDDELANLAAEMAGGKVVNVVIPPEKPKQLLAKVKEESFQEKTKKKTKSNQSWMNKK